MKSLFSFLTRITILIIAINLTSPVSSKAIHVDLFNVDNGLVQSGVTGVIQDSYGFLWIATQDGLNRYDGYYFKPFRNNPLDSSSLSNNYINAICEDRIGNIWLGTNLGLSMLDRKTGKFINYYSKVNDPSTLSDNRIYTVYQDKKGTIWVKTLTSLDEFDSAKKTFTRYPHYNDLFTFTTDFTDFDIFEDSQDVLWVGTKDGLCFFDRQLKIFKRFTNNPQDPKSISNDKIKDIFEDSYGNLWIGTENGLNRFDRKNNKFTLLFDGSDKKNKLQSSVINVITEDHTGVLWIGTDVGFSSYDSKTNTLTNYNNLNSKEGDKLITTIVTSICEDRSGILWVGSYQGLIKWNRKPLKFKQFSKNSLGEPLFANNIIASILQDNTGKIWLGTWGAGLFQFDAKTGDKILYSSELSGRRICNDFVHSLFVNRNNEFIIGTRNGIQVYIPNNKQFVDYFTSKGIDSYGLFKNNRVYAFAEDQKGSLWVASKRGLFQVKDKAIIGYYNDPADSTSLTPGEVYDVIADKYGFIWAGTLNGLNKIEPNTKKITRFVQKANYTGTQLIDNEVMCLLEDSKGYIWVGTSNGLHRLDVSKGKFKLYTEDSGLPNNLIYSLEEDGKGRIWVSTNWGLAVLNPQTDIVKSYDVLDGLQSQEYNIGASHKSKSGELFFGGIAGFNSFFPDSISPNKTVSNVAITSFELLGKQKGKKSISVEYLDEVVIPKDYSVFTIEFSTLDFSRPEKNQYAYRMQGLSDEWVDLGTKHSATFSNLNAGTYYFTVKGSNSDMSWNEQGKTLKITVNISFWRSRMAYGLYAILIVALIFFYLRNRTKNLRKTNRLLKEREYAMVKVENQKEELMLKNKSITDSINYAKRLQEAIMPSIAHFKKLLPDSFLLYMPKDIVSGDFYWINETKNKLFVAVVDCTGHGVPGAFMSIIGVELLRNITNIQGVNDAAEILNRLNLGVIQTFSKDFIDDSALVKDGMDVAFCVIDKENNILQYAGAFSNLYLIRDNKIIEIKGDRYSVGIGNIDEKQHYSSHFIPIQPDDMIYIFTDGYVDQFGGPDNKKYKFRRFRHLLLNIHKYPLETQQQYIEDSILEWKGDNDQVDDILIIGIKPDLNCLF